jgi:hypothetical protein
MELPGLTSADDARLPGCGCCYGHRPLVRPRPVCMPRQSCVPPMRPIGRHACYRVHPSSRAMPELVTGQAWLPQVARVERGPPAARAMMWSTTSAASITPVDKHISHRGSRRSWAARVRLPRLVLNECLAVTSARRPRSAWRRAADHAGTPEPAHSRRRSLPCTEPDPPRSARETAGCRPAP